MSQASTIKGRKQTSAAGRILPGLLLVAIGLVGAMVLSSSVVAVACLLPTAAAFIFDRDSRKPAATCVGLMNGAGTAGFLIRLWLKGHSMDMALEIISRPETWLVSYGAAALGWLIYFSVPSVFQIVLAQRTRARIAELEEHQAALRRLWGEDVKNGQVYP